MTGHAYDLVVLGTGPAGQRAAIQAAKLGKSMAVCEKREVVGGSSVHTGTIPSKTFREAVLSLTGLSERAFYGASYVVKEKITMQDLLSRCDAVVRREIDVVRAQMHRNGVTVLSGSASFVDPHTLRVASRAGGTAEVTADFVVIATGTVPAPPPGVPVDGETVIDSDGLLQLRSLPRTMTVVGAGVIGVEYATMFAALGVEVTLIDKRPRLLEFLDAEIAEALSYQMRNRDCVFRLGEDVANVTVDRPHHAVATLKSGKTVASELLLYSVGRIGATAELNLEAAGLKADDRGRIAVDAQYRTAVPHVFAVGDVIGFPSLASTSLEQGRLAACHAFGARADTTPELYPFGIYSIPEISMVGKNEEELTNAGVPYEIGLAHYREIARGAIMGDDSGLLKLVFHRDTRELLGVHILGTGATLLVHVGQAVMAFGGTIDYFVGTVFNYPTFAECYKVAALDGYNKVGPPPGRAEPSGT